MNVFISQLAQNQVSSQFHLQHPASQRCSAAPVTSPSNNVTVCYWHTLMYTSTSTDQMIGKNQQKQEFSGCVLVKNYFFSSKKSWRIYNFAQELDFEKLNRLKCSGFSRHFHLNLYFLCKIFSSSPQVLSFLQNQEFSLTAKHIICPILYIGQIILSL